MTELIPLASLPARFAAERPDAIAVTSASGDLTWGELDRRTNRIARALEALGVRANDFVTLALPNDACFVEAVWGIWKAGATPQPVSWRLPPAEVAGIVELANPPVVIAGPEIQVVGRPRLSVADLLAASDDAGPLPDRIALHANALTSGGSTGRPKLIVSNEPAAVMEGKISSWRVGPDSISVVPGPLYHSGPWGGAFTTLMAGGRLVVLPRFEPEAVLQAVATHRATWLYQVPTMMGRIWRLPDDVKAAYDLSSLQSVWHLAAPCPPWLKEAWIGWVGGEVLMELYSGTEGIAVTKISGTEWLAHRGSVGRVMSGEMKVVDAEGRTVPAGVHGEIYLRPGAERGGMPYHYVGAEARAQPGGWESLGDMGWFDAEGYLYLGDRRTDMILVGGANVYPAEVEAALGQHPLVLSSAVIGLPDDDMGNRIHAIVQPAAGLDLDDLQRHLAEHLVGYKRPRSFELIDEPLRDEAGKVRRSQLRDARLAATS
ncbi:MAG: AMP-binding protein [Alphaproteobacteria bacterium]|nr:AMP-binding protein [Alphaproteobacteria bacterium]MBU1515412.1 AMP-binding protein [Alphaproteobacteria bacterium]MBU2092953.1 AMP-binding protein [Alphaproteobacteria bacterium]MBU2153585.1 AMP-binding protein [Alphaproteobacteria bacterium]MBU2309898.1 AMP-binding protein [Alphaproteobacteria bacterium]